MASALSFADGLFKVSVKLPRCWRCDAFGFSGEAFIVQSFENVSYGGCHEAYMAISYCGIRIAVTIVRYCFCVSDLQILVS